MIATDTLSLVFVGCFVFSGAFLVITSLLGLGHHAVGGHTTHVGGHGGHVGHAHGGVGAHSASSTTHAAALPQHPTPGMRIVLPNHAASSHQATSGQSTSSDMGSSLISLLGLVNLNAVLAFLFCFGLFGYVLHNITPAGALVAILIALILGMIAGMGINLLYAQLLGRETGRLGASSSTVEGRIAKISIPVRAGGLGEVIYEGDQGSRHSLGARSTDGSAIPRDADVVIVEYINGIALVQEWDAFLASARADSHLLPQSIERGG